MTTAQQYRSKAEACARRAREVASMGDRQQLLQMQQEYLEQALAEERRREAAKSLQKTG